MKYGLRSSRLKAFVVLSISELGYYTKLNIQCFITENEREEKEPVIKAKPLTITGKRSKSNANDNTQSMNVGTASAVFALRRSSPKTKDENRRLMAGKRKSSWESEKGWQLGLKVQIKLKKTWSRAFIP
ncbi:hypothetical protein U1Q18_049823 [Sarracenia purpurea var. burkii]